MLPTFLLTAVLVVLLVLLVLHLVGSTRIHTRLDEFNRQVGSQTEQGETRIHKLEEILRGLEKDLREDVEGVRVKVDESLEMLKEALKKQQSLAKAHLYMGNIYFHTERQEAAKRAWKKCLEWDAQNIEAKRGIRLINQRAEKKKTGLAAFFDKLLGKK